MASARHMLTIEPRQWDRDPWLLNVLNGTVDLKTGEIRPHRQEDLITMLTRVEYDPEAQSKFFLDFLEEVQPDGETRATSRVASSPTGGTSWLSACSAST